ncbi:MAG: type II toxin-antitoxin system VapC family toxin [Deltaproteobacteria bacterium]|nr:type II toxin-antitoxin system VapC family toxin [Deltaproteobacteria bacterium]
MIVLDTHAWIWFAADDRELSDSAMQAIRQADRVGVSAISVWEVGMLCAKGRIQLQPDARRWVHRALRIDRVELLPLSEEIALLATEMVLHGDPADRIIVATASACGAQLVTRDTRIRSAGLVPIVW